VAAACDGEADVTSSTSISTSGGALLPTASSPLLPTSPAGTDDAIAAISAAADDDEFDFDHIPSIEDYGISGGSRAQLGFSSGSVIPTEFPEPEAPSPARAALPSPIAAPLPSASEAEVETEPEVLPDLVVVPAIHSRIAALGSPDLDDSLDLTSFNITSVVLKGMEADADETEPDALAKEQHPEEGDEEKQQQQQLEPVEASSADVSHVSSVALHVSEPEPEVKALADTLAAEVETVLGPNGEEPTAQAVEVVEGNVEDLPVFAPITEEEYAAMPNYFSLTLDREKLNTALAAIKNCVIQTDAQISDVVFTQSQLRDALGLGSIAKPVLLILIKLKRLEGKAKNDDGEIYYSFRTE
jgi:hypothetical protein